MTLKFVLLPIISFFSFSLHVIFTAAGIEEHIQENIKTTDEGDGFTGDKILRIIIKPIKTNHEWV